MSVLNFHSFSQTLTSNPYSYFGLGIIQNKGFSENAALGSSGIAMPSINNLNSTNPASYVGIDSSSFIFSFGLYGKNSAFETRDNKQSTFDGGLNYIALGFKISRYWAASFGLTPFSSRGYYISSKYPTEGDLSEYQLISTGSGNLSNFYFSNSFKIVKNLSLGANISYLFGSLQNVEQMVYSDPNFKDVEINTTNYFRNFFFDFGLQYKFKVGKNEFYTGLTYNPRQNLNTSYKKIAINGTDTLANIDQGNGNFTIPASVGIGFGANLLDKQLKFMADYKATQWSKSDYHYTVAMLKDSWQINTGVEFVRENKHSNNYWDYVNFRVGYRYENSYLSINTHNLNENAVSLGFGFPLKYNRSKINLSYEYAVMGTTDANLIQERYSRIIIGFTLYDKWFQRLRYD